MTETASRPTLEEMQAAARGLEGVVLHTPLVPFGDTEDVFLKPEILQPVTSFKLRGIYHAVTRLSPEAREAGVSTVSAGNTAQALAWTARGLGIPARSVMPDRAPQTKIDAVRALGATPVLVPIDEVFRYMREHLWESEPYAFIHPWTNRDVMTGHGGIGLEIVGDMPDVDTVFIPVGGGGLLGGLGSALRACKPGIRIVGVEPEGCPSLHAALAAGKPVTVESRTICDGVAVPYITDEMFPLLRDLVDAVTLVSEAAVRSAIRFLARRHKMIVEGAGALSVVAATATPPAERGKSVCILSGGSLDTDLLVEILRESG